MQARISHLTDNVKSWLPTCAATHPASKQPASSLSPSETSFCVKNNVLVNRVHQFSSLCQMFNGQCKAMHTNEKKLSSLLLRADNVAWEYRRACARTHSTSHIPKEYPVAVWCR